MPFPKPAVRRGFQRVGCSLVFSLLICVVSTVSGLMAAEFDRSSTTPQPARPMGKAVRVEPAILAFGKVDVGANRTLPVSIRNLTRSSIIFSRGNEIGDDFRVNGLDLPLTIEPGHSFSFSVTFEPHSGGAISGAIRAEDSLKSVLTIPLKGTGLAAGRLVCWPRNVDFGNVRQGNTVVRNAVLTALGSSVTVYKASIKGPEFAALDLPSPLVLAPGQSVAYRVVFHPKHAGKTKAELSFDSTAINSLDQSLDGDGMPPQTYTVSLSWQQSNSQVVGYNIYRGTISGGPYSMINPSIDPTTTYIDNTAQGEQTYYYVTTAVNSNGEESPYSNEAEVTTP